MYTARNINSWLQFYLQSQKHGQLTAVVCTQPDACTDDCSFIYKDRNMVSWLQLCFHSQKHEQLPAVLFTKPETWSADCSCVYTARNMNGWLQFYLQSQKYGRLTALVCTQTYAWTADCSFVYTGRNMFSYWAWVYTVKTSPVTWTPELKHDDEDNFTAYWCENKFKYILWESIAGFSYYKIYL